MRKSASLVDRSPLDHLIDPFEGDMDAGAARAVLKLRFDRKTIQSIDQLLKKNSKGTITAEERIALDKFVRTGQLIDTMQAKARRSLKNSGIEE